MKMATRHNLRAVAAETKQVIFAAELFSILHPATLPMLEQMFEEIRQSADFDGEPELKRRAELGIAAVRLAAREHDGLDS